MTIIRPFYDFAQDGYTEQRSSKAWERSDHECTLPEGEVQEQKHKGYGHPLPGIGAQGKFITTDRTLLR